jgi:hypothetical protein
MLLHLLACCLTTCCCCCCCCCTSSPVGVRNADIERPVAGNPTVYGINTAVLALAAGFAAASPQFVSSIPHIALVLQTLLIKHDSNTKCACVW